MCCDLARFDAFSLGRPSVLGENFIVGTDDPAASQHMLVALSAEEIMGKMRPDHVVLGHCKVSEVTCSAHK